jgi:hypothetical protein
MCTVYDDQPELARLPRLRKVQINGLLASLNASSRARAVFNVTLLPHKSTRPTRQLSFAQVLVSSKCLILSAVVGAYDGGAKV